MGIVQSLDLAKIWLVSNQRNHVQVLRQTKLSLRSVLRTRLVCRKTETHDKLFAVAHNVIAGNCCTMLGQALAGLLAG
jgi:hypothetical protein